MTPQAQTILERFQVRKSKKQKEAFRQYLTRELEQQGYRVVTEVSGGNYNVVAGDPEAPVLLTAHYDTQAVLPFPNFITPRNLLIYVLYNLLICLGFFALVALAEAALFLLWPDAPFWAPPFTSVAVCVFCIWWMLDGKANKHTANDNTSGVLTLVETALALPEELRGQVCFVFFDNEEKGMLGSRAFARDHRQAAREALVLNFDCVGDGDHLQFFPGRGAKKDAAALALLERSFEGGGSKRTELVRGFGFYPSDNASFRRGVGICALHRGAVGYYMGRIHTARDTVLDRENLRVLTGGAVRLAAALAAQDRTDSPGQRGHETDRERGHA